MEQCTLRPIAPIEGHEIPRTLGTYKKIEEAAHRATTIYAFHRKEVIFDGVVHDPTVIYKKHKIARLAADAEWSL
jgi:hypothetical protein